MARVVSLKRLRDAQCIFYSARVTESFGLFLRFDRRTYTYRATTYLTKMNSILINEESALDNTRTGYHPPMNALVYNYVNSKALIRFHCAAITNSCLKCYSPMNDRVQLCNLAVTLFHVFRWNEMSIITFLVICKVK